MSNKYQITKDSLDKLQEQVPQEVIDKLNNSLAFLPQNPVDETEFFQLLNKILEQEFKADPNLEKIILDSSVAPKQAPPTEEGNSVEVNDNNTPAVATDNSEPPPPALSKEWSHSLTLMSIGVVILIIFSVLWCNCNTEDNSGLVGCSFMAPLLIAFGIILISAFLYLFTGKITERKMNLMFLYGYLFTFFAIIVSLLPFIWYSHKDSGIYRHMLETPIGVFIGCSQKYDNVHENLSGVPSEIKCDNKSDQWVVNIGGKVIAQPIFLFDKESIEKLKELKDKNGESAVPPKVIAKLETKSKWLFTTYDNFYKTISDIIDLLQNEDGEGIDKVEILKNVSDHEQEIIKESKTIKMDNVLGSPVKISGGLVVPLYFIVLALIGAAVSIMRRIPEYQRRVVSGEEKQITKEKAREYLVFQIMQFLSAPIIAVTAYYLLDPGSSKKLTIVIGFASGFASESILVMIRALVEKLRPSIESVDDKKHSVDSIITQVEDKKRAKAELDQEITDLGAELKKLKDDTATSEQIKSKKEDEIKKKQDERKLLETEIKNLENQVSATLKAKGIG